MKREPNEPIILFNTRFQKVYSRISLAYKPIEALALMMYQNSIDPMITVFLRRVVGINTLALAYAEAINIDQQLNPQGHPFFVIYGTSQVPVLNPMPITSINPWASLVPNQSSGPTNDHTFRALQNLNSALVPINNTISIVPQDHNKNELEAITRMVQKLGNDFISIQR